MFRKLQEIMSSGGEDVWTSFYRAMESEGCIDVKYLEHTTGQDLESAVKHADRLSKEEVCTWLTWILRGERFCEGLFESCIENGSFSALLSRGVELSK